jgi:Holliday junction resolvase RusA-like endonuclease
MKRRPIKIEIPGDPISWARPGQNKKRRFDTQDSQKYAVGLVVKAQMKAAGVKEINGPVFARFEFLMPIPKYRYKEIKHRMKEGEIVWHTTKPDTDNLIKFYGDALNKVLWNDDRLISSVLGEKLYSLKPRTVIEVSEL